jgi:hypothetical protein
VNAKLKEKLGAKSMLNSFLDACLRADNLNYEILRHVLHIFMEKYPARKEFLKIEEEDSANMEGP